MSAIDERAAHIRMFTVPDRAVGFSAVFQYAAVAADWERLRLRVNRNPVPVLADDERFSAMSLSLRKLSAELGLKTCSAKTAGTEDVIGITGRRGCYPTTPATSIPLPGLNTPRVGAAKPSSGYEDPRLHPNRGQPSAWESDGRAGHQLNDSTVAFHLDPGGVAWIHTDDHALPADP